MSPPLSKLQELVKNRKGVILLYVFIFMVALTLLAVVYMENNIKDHRFVSDAEHEIQARWLAYAGICQGVKKLDKDPSFRGSLPLETMNTGTVLVKISETSSRKIKITSTGVSAHVQIQAEKVIAREESK
ncbi:MAG: hypothetical protein JW774_12180 [Candidatus Aureabacteria bacterium]|nr:hypothetical protein [Candidatus Auribacterota bacterium]